MTRTLTNVDPGSSTGSGGGGGGGGGSGDVTQTGDHTFTGTNQFSGSTKLTSLPNTNVLKTLNDGSLADGSSGVAYTSQDNVYTHSNTYNGTFTAFGQTLLSAPLIANLPQFIESALDTAARASMSNIKVLGTNQNAQISSSTLASSDLSDSSSLVNTTGGQSISGLTTLMNCTVTGLLTATTLYGRSTGQSHIVLTHIPGNTSNLLTQFSAAIGGGVHTVDFTSTIVAGLSSTQLSDSSSLVKTSGGQSIGGTTTFNTAKVTGNLRANYIDDVNTRSHIVLTHAGTMDNIYTQFTPSSGSTFVHTVDFSNTTINGLPSTQLSDSSSIHREGQSCVVSGSGNGLVVNSETDGIRFLNSSLQGCFLKTDDNGFLTSTTDICDLSTTQTVGGAKSYSEDVTVASGKDFKKTGVGYGLFEQLALMQPSQWEYLDATGVGTYNTGFQSHSTFGATHDAGPAAIRYQTYNVNGTAVRHVFLRGTVRKSDSSNIPDESLLFTLSANFRVGRSHMFVCGGAAGDYSCQVKVANNGDVSMHRRHESDDPPSSGILTFVNLDGIHWFTDST